MNNLQEKTRNFELPNKSFQFKTTRINQKKTSQPSVLVRKGNQLFHIAATQVGVNKFGLLVGNNNLFSDKETLLSSYRGEKIENNADFDSYGQSFGINTQNTYRSSDGGLESRQSEQQIKKTGNTLSRIQLNIFQKSHSGFDIRIEGSSRGSSVFDNKQAVQQQQKHQRYMIQKISESSGSLNRKFSLDQIESKINISEYGASVLPRGLTQDYQKLKAFELSAIHKKDGMSPQVLYQQYLTTNKPQKSQRSQTIQKSNSHAVLRQDQVQNDDKVSFDLSQQGVSIRFEKRPSDVKIASAKSKLISVLNDANKRHQSSINYYKTNHTEDPFSNSISQEDHLLNFQVRLNSKENFPKKQQSNKILRNKLNQKDSTNDDLGVYKENSQQLNNFGNKRKTLSFEYSNIDPQRNETDFNQLTNQSIDFSYDSKVDLLASLIKNPQ